MNLKDLDFLGGNINFSINRSAKLKSNFGGCFTIFMTLVLGLLMFGLGRNFFRRENPIVLSSVEIPPSYKFINMTTKEVSFALRFEDYDGNAIKNDRAFYIKGNYFYQKLLENGEWDVLQEELEIKECEGLDFPEGPFRSDEVAKEYLCPKFDGKVFGGFWTNDIVSNFVFRAYYCSEGFENHKGEKCLSDDEKDKILKDISYISLYQETLEAFPLSYDEPLKRKVENIFFVLDKKATKGITVNFKNTTVITDYGWMIEDKTIISKVGVGNYLVDVFNINLFNSKDGPYMISEITLYYSKDSNEYIRAYQKLSELAANVGGILEIFLISGYAMVAFYNDCKNMLEFNVLISGVENPNNKIIKIVESVKNNLRNNAFNTSDFDGGFLQDKLNNIHKKTTSSTKNMNDWNSEIKKLDIKDKDKQSENLILSNNVDDYSTIKGNIENDNSIINPSSNSNMTNNLVKVNVNIDSNRVFDKSVESEKSSNQIKEIDKTNIIEEKEIGFFGIVKSLAFRYSLEGKLCCCSKDKIEYYRMIENRYEDTLSFKKYIEIKSSIKRMKEILFTNEQIIILESDSHEMTT